MTYSVNIGELPQAAKVFDDDGLVSGYRKVHVRLRGGYDSKRAMADPWPAAGGRPGTRWMLDGSQFDIIEWCLA